MYNKEFFFYYAEKILRDDPTVQYSIVYTDVDNFKIINACYGKIVGDELIKYLAKRFQYFVGEKGICGRINADNFALLIPGIPFSSQKQAKTENEKLLLNAPVREFQIKAGVYTCGDEEIPMSDMCDRARLALSSIKHQYGAYYATYDSSMLNKAIREHRLEDSMEEALKTKEFLIYLQPKHATSNTALAGAEALVRWKHHELGFIFPNEFITLFEKNGFIAKLDYYMLDETCKSLRQWIDEGISPVPISVNISRASFTKEDLPERLAKLVDSYNLPHELVHIEVTESSYSKNSEQIISSIITLRNMGFRIEMDDFGSGYSSLNMLSELPIDVLKLDMRFIQSGKEWIEGGKQNILNFIIKLSKWLHVPTVAEGVETEDDFNLLKNMGCEYIQGYYFSKPMPRSEFKEYIQTWAKKIQ